MRNSQPENSQALRDRALRRDDPARARRAAARQRRAGNSTRFQRISGLGHAASSVRRLGAAVVLFVAAGVLGGGPAAARTSTSAADDFTLSTSVLSLTERDDPTEVTVTAVLSDPAADETMIKLDLGRSPLLTPGVRRGATNGRDYTAEFESSTITIAAGSTTGSTTLTVDPVYDNAVEGDEAIVVRGRTDAGRFIDATDLILEDGPYLSFPRHIVGSLNYPGQAIAVTVRRSSRQSQALQHGHVLPHPHRARRRPARVDLRPRDPAVDRHRPRVRRRPPPGGSPPATPSPPATASATSRPLW